MSLSLRRNRVRAWLFVRCLLCVLCLLGFQAAGHWHRIAHADALAGISSAVDTEWGHHSGDADCHLFDQLGQDHGPASTATLHGGAQIHPVPVSARCTHVDLAAFWKRGARGPPVSV